MKSLKVTSMLAVLMFLFITGMQAQTVTPSKKYITKELNNVSNFSSIKVLGSTDVEYRQSSGSKTEISIYGSDNLVDLLEVSTANGVLQVNIKKGVKILSGERRLKVIASSPCRFPRRWVMSFNYYTLLQPSAVFPRRRLIISSSKMRGTIVAITPVSSVGWIPKAKQICT